jgi:hypothetical protein
MITNLEKSNDDNKLNKKNKTINHNNKTLKKLNCSPEVDELIINKDSCYTNDIIIQVRDAYNNGHANNKITATDPNNIWNELKTRLSTCNREDCWLDEIKDHSLRKRIKDYIFSPDSPERWSESLIIKNKSKRKTSKNQNNKEEELWLWGGDFLKVFYQYEKRYKCFKFIGPATIDFDSKPKKFRGQCVDNELCNFSLKNHLDNKKTKIGVILNLDKYFQEGSHWVAMFIDIKNKFIFYFESQLYIDSNDNDYEKDIPEQVIVFKDRIIQQGLELQNPINFTFYSTKKTHQYSNYECGMYSLFFIITMLTEKINNVHIDLKKRLDFFIKRRIPDKFINKYRSLYFNEK